MTKKVLIIGGRGNGSNIAAAIKDANIRGFNQYKVCGFLNDKEKIGSFIDEFPVIDSISEIKKYIKQGYFFVYSIFKIGGQKERIKFLKKINIPEERLVTFIHPLAYVAPSTKIGKGTIVMPNVTISPTTSIGKNCLIYQNSSVGHDNKIGDFCQISAQACIGSYLEVGEGVTFGINCTVMENLTIESYATIGIGGVLTKNVSSGETWAGNPARLLSKSS